MGGREVDDETNKYDFVQPRNTAMMVSTATNTSNF
jgi:hypothetical protein